MENKNLGFMRLYIQAPFLLLALLFGITAAPVSGEPAQGIVSFTFDDASKVQYRNGLPIAEVYGIVGTIYVPTGLIDQSTSGTDYGWLMNWDEVLEFQQAGWEIGSHSRTHPRLSEIDPIAIEVELLGSRMDIEERVGVRPVSFSSPFGDFDDASIEEIMKWYDSHVSWKGHLGRNPIDAIDSRYIGRMEVMRARSSTEICGEMLRAAQTNTWLVLLFHGIVDENPGESQITPLVFSEILSCANLLSEAGIIQVKTVRDAMDEIETRD